MTVRKSTEPVHYDDRTSNEKLVDIFKKLVLVVQSRGGDVGTADGNFATVDLDEFLMLEQEFEDIFERSVEEVVNLEQVRWLVKNKILKGGVL